MREYKFRGKSIKTGEWVYGDLQRNEIGDTWISKLHTDVSESIFENVDPKTVGQYAVLKDKNDIKIYEGDIVDIHQTVNGQNKFIVFWNKDKSRYTVRYCSIDYREYEYSLTEFWGKCEFSGDVDYEVIGNIHENPELLEVKE